MMFAFSTLIASAAVANALPARRDTQYTTEIQWRVGGDKPYCLSVDNNKIADGTHMQLWDCSQSIGQMFLVTENTNEGAFDGLIRLAQSPNYCVVIDGNSSSEGAAIQLWSCDSATVQEWVTGSTKTGLEIMNKANDMKMTVSGNNAYNGAKVVIGSAENAYWDFSDEVPTAAVATKARRDTITSEIQWRVGGNSPYCLSVENNNIADGTHLQLWDCSESIGQMFIINEGNGGLIKLAHNPDYCVVIDNNSSSDGAAIQLWSCDGATVQEWVTGSTKTGLEIMNKGNDMKMSISGNNAYNGAKVVISSAENAYWDFTNDN